MSEKRLLVADELHSPPRRNFPQKHVIVHGYDDLYQADVVKMHPYTRINRSYHYSLTVINVLSKHVQAVPLKLKSGNEMTQAIITKIIRGDGRYPKNLQTNRGKEFYNSDVQKLLKKHNVDYSTYSVMKARSLNRTVEE
ncbi:PREDICTED: uncharacterized protein LOC108751547 [Trachymyrmex septentrionalis]|uniref:uncharacterized protein LOC108751547 n=1 Tax=Trachymyrmex septentrionalis TaxID=34720 RepID=UPI00084F2916|nr:PREDICTED: uncharacterized protein LOC108751547 [Trachymyrmex septentrionalis]